MKDLLRILKFAWIKKGLTISVSISATSLVIIEVVYPLIIKQIFDLLEGQIKEGNLSFDPNKFIAPFSMYVFLVIMSAAIRLWYTYYETKWWLGTRNAVIEKVFNHLQSLDLSFFEKSSTGKLIEKLSNGVGNMQNIMEDVIEDIIPQMLYMIIAIVILFKVNVTFGLVVSIGVPLFAFISTRYTKTLNALQDKTRDYEEKAGMVRVESLSNIKTVKSFTAEKRHSKDLMGHTDRSMQMSLRRMKKYVQMNTMRFTITNTSRFFAIGAGVYWVSTGKITFGTLFLVWTYVNGIYNPLWRLSYIYDNAQRNMRSVRRVFEILDTKPDIEDAKNAVSLGKNVRGEIGFSGVKFGYENRHVINGLDLKIPAGSVVAVVGKSGVGKSTLVKLLLRFYDPQEGKISIDGHDIKNVTQKSLRQNIGVVLQDTAIFNETAFNNIAYAKPKASKEEIIRAAKVAHAHEFISKLSEGYSTIVGEKGVKLSGGEQQRVNIARAVLKNPPILILDEATSHLDSESEKLIQDALWKLIKGRTSIIIAHRLSTIMKADMIVVLDKGKISEIGTHDELVRKEGIYNKLFKIQSGSYLK